MKYHILYEFRTFTPFKEKFSNHFKDLHKVFECWCGKQHQCLCYWETKVRKHCNNVYFFNCLFCPPQTLCSRWNTSSNVSSWYENMRKIWTSRRSRDVYLFRMFFDRDETRGNRARWKLDRKWWRVRDWASDLIHMIQTQQSGWKLGSWIINECEKKKWISAPCF